jgi:hypothetical protein
VRLVAIWNSSKAVFYQRVVTDNGGAGPVGPPAWRELSERLARRRLINT